MSTDSPHDWNTQLRRRGSDRPQGNKGDAASAFQALVALLHTELSTRRPLSLQRGVHARGFGL